MAGSPPPASGDAARRAFGAENRARLLTRYFEAAAEVTAANAWQHVYRLLLWVDRTTALAHCYESDKAQPGRPWYVRSLAFHDWVSRELGVEPGALGEHVDWLFREAVLDLARQPVIKRSAAYQEQRAPYEGRRFPQPGDDPELVALVHESLRHRFHSSPTEEEYRALARRILTYLSQENKRRNLVGEGFEDTLTALVTRLHVPGLAVRNRAALHELPGFHAPPPSEKTKRVDLALVREDRRMLVSSKWSIRADREEQFHSDFEAYARLESAGRDFDYVLVTNEFDAARLRAACERRRQNAPLFTRVVHINPTGVLRAYADDVRGSAPALRAHVASGRLGSLESWLDELATW